MHPFCLARVIGITLCASDHSKTTPILLLNPYYSLSLFTVDHLYLVALPVVDGDNDNTQCNTYLVTHFMARRYFVTERLMQILKLKPG